MANETLAAEAQVELRALSEVEKRALDDVFSYHAPDFDQIPRYALIRDAGRDLAEVVLRCAPACRDTEAAIDHLRMAVMRASAAIALRGCASLDALVGWL